MFTIDKFDYDSETSSVYGFMVYREDGHSLPKGMITSFNAYFHKSKITSDNVQIEFAVQSPTGDASDHYHYIMLCDNFNQAKAIVDSYHNGVSTMLGEYRKQELYS